MEHVFIAIEAARIAVCHDGIALAGTSMIGESCTYLEVDGKSLSYLGIAYPAEGNALEEIIIVVGGISVVGGLHNCSLESQLYAVEEFLLCGS